MKRQFTTTLGRVTTQKTQQMYRNGNFIQTHFKVINLHVSQVSFLFTRKHLRQSTIRLLYVKLSPASNRKNLRDDKVLQTALPISTDVLSLQVTNTQDHNLCSLG